MKGRKEGKELKLQSVVLGLGLCICKAPRLAPGQPGEGALGLQTAQVGSQPYFLGLMCELCSLDLSIVSSGKSAFTTLQTGKL